MYINVCNKKMFMLEYFLLIEKLIFVSMWHSAEQKLTSGHEQRLKVFATANTVTPFNASVQDKCQVLREGFEERKPFRHVEPTLIVEN